MGLGFRSTRFLKFFNGLGLVALVSGALVTSSCSMQFFRNKFRDSGKLVLKNTKTTVEVGTTYTIDLAGGNKPFTYKIISGPGLISSSGVYTAPASITSPLPDGTEMVVIMVTDQKGKSTTITLFVIDALVINDNDVDMQPGDTFPFSALGGKPPYAFSVLSGLGSVDPTGGLFTSTASQGVSYVRVTDSDGNTDDALISVFWVLDPTAVNINIPANTTYNIAPSTGKPPFSFVITSGLGSVSPASGSSSTFTAPAAPGLTDVTVTDALSVTKVYTFNTYLPLTYVPSSKNVLISTSFPFGVTGGVPPYSHAVISGGASGSIVAGTGNFTATATPGTVVIQVTDSISNTTTASVNVYPPLTISPSTFSMMVNDNQTFSGGGGVPPYAYSVFAGGGSINPTTGAYTAPAAPGSVTIRVTDAELNIANASVTVTGPLTLPPLILLAPTNFYAITPSGGQAPFTFAVTAGTAGGSLSTPGPAASSTYTAALPTGTNTITVTDSSTPTAQTATMDIQVVPALGMSCTPTTITVSNTSTCTATNGVPGYTYSVVGGAPNGTVTVGGVYTPPATPGTYTVRVTDSYGNIINVPITVNAAIALSPSSATIAVAQNQVVTVSGGVGPYTFSKQSGPGDTSVTTLTATTARADAGMTPGTIVVHVVDSLGNATTASIGIGTPPAINGAPSTRNIHKSQTNTITPSGGAPSVNGSLQYSFAIVSGSGSLSVASGMSTIYTAPASTGSATVRITDGVSTAYDIVYTIIDDLTISPTAITLMVNNNTTFTASNVVGTATYSVVSVGGGSIVAGTGAYTAPGTVPGANPATIRVTDSGPQQADALVTIMPQLAATPAAFNLLVTETQVINISGGVQPYTFSFTGTTGSISPTGAQGMGVTSTTYTAGASAGTGTFTVTDNIGNFVNVAISVGNVPPPTGFIVTGATPTSINTSWNTVAGATGYKVRANGGGWTDIGNVLTYNFTGLATGSLHSLEVLAYNGGGDGAATSLSQRICAVDVRLNAGACTACSIGEYSAGGITASCTVCSNASGNFIYTSTGGGINNCSYACNNGYGSSSCNACGGGTYDSVGGGQENCINCSASTYSNGAANASCTNCSVGTWSAAGASSCGACTNNTAGFYWTSNGTTATGCTNTACTNGPALNKTYIGHGGTTDSCAYECNAGYGSGTCTQCTAGNYDGTAGGTEACVACTASNYSGAGATSCTACAVGTYSGAGAPSCSPCTNTTVGQYWTGNSSTSTCPSAACTNTTAGFYWNTHGGTSATGCNNTSCTGKPITSTYTSHGGTTDSCTYACNNGYGTASCTQCAIDTRDGTAGGQEACVACGAGEFAAAGSTSCTPCSGKPVTSTYISTGGGINNCTYACNNGYGTASCTQCAIDTYDSAGGGQEACVACGVGEFAAAGSTSCTTCSGKPVTSTYTSTGGGINNCTYACNNGYGTASCTQCAIDTRDGTAGGQEACVACGSGEFSVAGSTSCTVCSNKPVDSTYAGTGGGANNCPYDCNAGFGSSSCTQCTASNYDSVGGGQEACAACASGTWSSAGATSCSACTNTTVGQYWTGNSSTSTCPSAACTNTTAGFYWNTHGGTSATGCNNTACTGKPATSTYISHGGTSDSCAYACNNGYGTASCTQCGVDTYDSVGGGQEACVACGASEFAAAGSTSCTPCSNKPTNSTYTGATGGGSNNCAYNCSNGYGSSSCTQCAASTYDSAGGGTENCAACPVGQYSGAGATSCANCTNAPANSSSVTYSSNSTGNSCNFASVTCNGGYNWNGNTTAGGASCDLAACPSGTGWNGSACITCASGTYDATPGTLQDACTSASAGYFVSGTGATSQTACAAGTYQGSTGQSSCTPASAGHYAAGTGNTGQTACAAGTYQGSTGQSSCTPASAGYYAAGTGNTGQTACAAGTYQGSTGQSSCTSASAGYYAAGTGNTGQTACAAGTYQPSTGQSSCISASVDYRATGTGNTTQTACNVGEYAAGGAANCTTCSNAPFGFVSSYGYSTTGGGGNSCNFSYVSCTTVAYIHNGDLTWSGAGCVCGTPCAPPNTYLGNCIADGCGPGDARQDYCDSNGCTTAICTTGNVCY